ncbi:hypothetical protein [Marinicella marina]|uniref:hypothetical protein n=1 Tax=Marinicella marina TaxID=2996016 RepID=UPI0024BD26AA|nr:hypothetical protein [Marinicella marina]MDJ1138813.1 hypothetical protein [Marinicella marina]
MKKYYILLLLIYSGIASSQNDCFFENDQPSLFFHKTETVAINIAKYICQNNIETRGQNSQLNTNLIDYLNLLKITANVETQELKNTGIDVSSLLDSFINNFNSSNRTKWPSFSINNFLGKYILSIDYNTEESVSFIESDDDKCLTTDAYGVSCSDVLEDFVYAFNLYKTLILKKEASKAVENSKFNTEQWREYFTSTRSQTPFELTINSKLYRDTITSKHFVPPPPLQVIFLHPNLMMEYVNKADDGNQFKQSLAIEWVGVNMWNSKIPFGASIMTSYSDRSGVRDVGHGLLFHFNNKYSIGVTDHDGETGFSISVDILKIFQSAQSKKSWFEKFNKENQND